MNKLIKDEEIVELTKDELLNNALNEANNKMLTKRAKLLFDLKLYKKSIDNDFNGEAYEDHTYQDGFKGYSLAKKDDNFYLVKPLDEAECSSYVVLELANPTEEEIALLKKGIKKNNTLYFISLGVFLVFLLLSFIAAVGVFFNNIASSSSFIAALGVSFAYGGTAFVVGLGLLVLIIRKGLKGQR